MLGAPDGGTLCVVGDNRKVARRPETKTRPPRRLFEIGHGERRNLLATEKAAPTTKAKLLLQIVARCISVAVFGS